MASGLWPPASYRMLLENSMPTACYFQWNSWKFEAILFVEGSLIEVIIDLWPPFWGIMMLKHQKKSICAASERLLIRWSKLLALLCLGRTYIFFDLDCPASVYCPASVWLSDLGWTVQISENEKFSCDKETSLSSFVTSEQSFKCSTEHLFHYCPLQGGTCISVQHSKSTYILN